MNQLITQGVHAGEDDTEHGGGVRAGQGFIRGDLGFIETAFPLLFINPAIVEVRARCTLSDKFCE